MNTRSYGFNGLGLGMNLDARILEWISVHASADAQAYLGTGNRSLLVLGTSAQITGLVGLKGSLRIGEHVRLAAILDAQYGPVFTALLAQGLIDAVNSGQSPSTSSTRKTGRSRGSPPSPARSRRFRSSG